MTAHKHAALMAQYAEDAFETGVPWVMWELKGGSGGWEPLSRHPMWRQASQYRRKPQTININGYEVPEPCRVAPEIGTECWLITFGSPHQFHWHRSRTLDHRLKEGRVHLTREAFDIHSKALLSFTKEQSE